MAARSAAAAAAATVAHVSPLRPGQVFMTLGQSDPGFKESMLRCVLGVGWGGGGGITSHFSFPNPVEQGAVPLLTPPTPPFPHTIRAIELGAALLLTSPYLPLPPHTIRAIELGAVLLLENLDEDMDDVIEQVGGEEGG